MSHRILKISESLRKNFWDARDSQEIKTAEAVELAIGELGPLAEALEALGFSKERDTRPIRIPVNEADLANLREASERLDIPQTQLMVLCLARWASRSGSKAPKAPKAAPASRPASQKAPKAPKARRAAKSPRKTTKGGAK